jgi:hypothetical protein
LVCPVGVLGCVVSQRPQRPQTEAAPRVRTGDGIIRHVADELDQLIADMREEALNIVKKAAETDPEAADWLRRYQAGEEGPRLTPRERAAIVRTARFLADLRPAWEEAEWRP